MLASLDRTGLNQQMQLLPREEDTYLLLLLATGLAAAAGWDSRHWTSATFYRIEKGEDFSK